MKAKLKPIHDQVVVLFGATSGIGLETALQMVEKGARVAIVGRSQEGLNDAMERVRQHAQAHREITNRTNGGSVYPIGRREWMQGEMGATGMTGTGESTGFASAESGGSPMGTSTMEDQVIALEADITKWEDVKGVADQVVQRMGRIDTWVNIAAVAEWALFEDTNPEEFRRIIEVNLLGHAYGTMAALPYMKQQGGGSIISVASIAGRVSVPYQSAYSASKHGLMGMIETLRQELRHTNVPVSVTAIIPASVNTPLFNKARTKLGVEPEPIPPIYDPRMVAKAIVYAASHPVRELIVGDSGYIVTYMRRLAPTLTNNFLGATGFRKQRSDEPKSAQAPDNMYHHVSGYNSVSGEFTPRTMKVSPLTWLSTHPKVKMGIVSALIAGAGFLVGSKIVRSRAQRRRSFSYRARNFGRQAGALLASLPMISDLPMFRRRTLPQRIIDAIPVDRKTIDRAYHRAYDGTVSRLPGRKPVAAKLTEKIADRGKIAAGAVVAGSKLAAHKVSDTVSDIHMPDIHMPDLRRRKTVMDRVKDKAEAVRDNITC